MDGDHRYRIYIGRLPHGTEERHIERFLKNYGRIREIKLKSGFGFVTFEDRRDAEDAVADLNNRKLNGEKIVVEACRGTTKGYSGPRPRNKYGAPTRTQYRVLVENLSTRVSWQDLKDYVRQAGEVTYGDAHRPVKGEGVLEFSSYSDVKNVIRKLDGSSLNGRKIRLIDDSPRGRPRSRSRSRSRSSSRGRRRSRSRSRSRSARSRSRSRSRSARSRSAASRSKSKSRSRSRSGSAKPRDASPSNEDRRSENNDVDQQQEQIKTEEDD